MSSRSHRTLITFATLVPCGAALLPLPAPAVEIPIVNPSFEAASLPDGVADNLAPAGWARSVTVFSGSYNPAVSDLFSVPDGENVAWSTNSQLSQVLTGQTLQAGTYTLSIMIGNPATRPGANNVGWFGLGVVGATLADQQGIRKDFIAPGTFAPFSRSVTVVAGDARIGQTLTVWFGNNGVTGPGLPYWVYDDIELQFTPVPEPASVLLLAVGLAALRLHRRSGRNGLGACPALACSR